MALPQRFGRRPERVGGLEDLPVRVQSFSDYANVDTVRSALLQFEQGGAFTQPAMLAEAMGRDDRIAAALRTRTQGLFGSPRNILPAQDNAKAEKVAEELEQQWSQIFPDAQIEQVFWWGVHFGFGLAEIIWERDSGAWTPRLKFWHPQFAWWNWGPRHYFVTTQDAGTIEILPGDGNWLVYSQGGYYRGWMTGLIRSLAVPWLIRQWAYRDWARASEVLGLGIKKATVPSTATADDKDQFFASLQSLGNESLVVLPQMDDGKGGFGFEFEKSVSSEGQAAAFKELIGKTEDSIAIAVLGQNLTTEVHGGSRAAARVHNEIRLDYRRADARSLADAIRSQVLRPWAAYNFGDPELAPRVEWDVEPEDDRQAAAQALATLATAVQTFQQAGAPIDVRAVLEQAAVPMVAEGDAPAVPQALRATEQVAVVAVFNLRGEMLWGRRNDNGRWTTPGGHVEPGEAIPQAARRGLREEAGILGDRLVPVATSHGDGLEVHGFTLVTEMAPSTEYDPDHEVSEWRWVDVSRGLPPDILGNLHVPVARNVLLAILGSRPQALRAVEAPQVTGQRYADGIVETATKQAARVLRPDVERVLEAIDQAESFEALRAELPKLLEAMDPGELAELTREASVLALLAGRHAVQRED